MQYYNNVLESIGNTPLIKLNKLTEEVKATVLAKVETQNPGNSIKDRIGLKMVEEAEKQGKIKPGGTIIEGTSGNTGLGLALAAIVKGYKCICTTNDKQSKAKIDMLRALNVEVIVCPTNVDSDDPRSYYSVARRLNEQIPNSFYPDQYNNMSNTQAHYESTGPEVWDQTDGKITHFVAGVGTGGTISGAGQYLKEQDDRVKVIGVDPYGSALAKYHRTGRFDPEELSPYLTEGIGEDIIPQNVNFDIIDHFEQVYDKESYMYARKLARMEGILGGNSSGSAIAGVLQMKDQFKKDDVVVVIIPDHASRYISKVFNDEWLRERGFLDEDTIKTRDIYTSKDPGTSDGLITIDKHTAVEDAVKIMQKAGIDQLPVMENGKMIGSITENRLYSQLIENPELKRLEVESVMGEPFPIVDKDAPSGEISKLLAKRSAVMTIDENGNYQVITKHDMIHTLTNSTSIM